MTTAAPILVVPALATLLVAVLALVIAGVLDSGFVRHAGWPSSLADLEGEWVLHRVRGDFDTAPPERLSFGPGRRAGAVLISDGTRSAEFELGGLGCFVFGAGHPFESLLSGTSAEVYTMTHGCPPLPEWDHLSFFPDGTPTGDGDQRRFIRYERD